MRDLNDEINRLLREKRHWENQIVALGGAVGNCGRALAGLGADAYVSGAVGSDALGIGLNLKIRRVIFTQVSKYSEFGGQDEQLWTSQIKQIGGRAGRFGLHGGKDADAGVVTTVKEEDLPVCTLVYDECFADDTGAPFARASEVFKHIAFRKPQCGDCGTSPTLSHRHLV